MNSPRFVSVTSRHPLASTWWHLLSLGFRYSASWWQMEMVMRALFQLVVVLWEQMVLQTVFFLKMVWYLAVGFCSRNLGPGETFWSETWKDGEFVCLKLVYFWSGLSTNQNRDSIPCRMIILRHCEPTNVRWDHLGLGKCSRRLRFVGVSWCHQSVSRFFSCSFEHPNKWSNCSEFRSTKIIDQLMTMISIFAVDSWHLWSWKFWGGLFVSINFRPCSFGSLQRRHWRCWFMSPMQNMLPASSTRQSQEILR